MPNTYSSELFSALPSLGEAKKTFSDSGARQYLEGPIRNLFLDSNVEGRYGVTLLHRHFDLAPTTRLVDYHHISTAWAAPDDTTDTFSKYDGEVFPRSWLFDVDGKIRPFEFSYVPKDGVLTHSGIENDAVFVAACHSLLRECGLERVFGLRDLESNDTDLTVEVTEGYANIMLPLNAVGSDGLIEAVWAFSPGPYTWKCNCREFCVVTVDGNGNDVHRSSHSC